MSGSETVKPATETATAGPKNDPSRAVVFFDGVCGMCNRSVDFIMKRDRKHRFLFSPLQGETADRELDREDTESLGSIVLRDGGNNYRKSTAIVRILWGLGGFWAILGALLWLIPWPLRDLGYKIIGSNRYRMFGKKEACRLPTPEERARFLP